MRSAPSMLIAKTTLTVVPKTLPLFLPVRQPPMTPAISVQRIYSSRNYGDNVINWSKSFGDGTADDWDEESNWKFCFVTIKEYIKQRNASAVDNEFKQWIVANKPSPDTFFYIIDKLLKMNEVVLAISYLEDLLSTQYSGLDQNKLMNCLQVAERTCSKQGYEELVKVVESFAAKVGVNLNAAKEAWKARKEERQPKKKTSANLRTGVVKQMKNLDELPEDYNHFANNIRARINKRK
ncbi:hypothetical protein AgCh_011239 [Apium graveolens]